MLLLPLIASMLAADPGPARRAVTVRLSRPRELGEHVLALFEGAKAPSPAAALAGYRRAKGGNSGLSKAAEAAIAAINPGMVSELALLDDATFHYGRTADGRPAWDVSIPRDDGTFEALGTAFALTDGASEPPLDGRPVDRLGPPGAPFLSRGPRALVIGSDRQAMADGLARPLMRHPTTFEQIVTRKAADDGPRIAIHVDANCLAGMGNDLLTRRIGTALLGLGAEEADLSIRFSVNDLVFSVPAPVRDPVQPEQRPAVNRWIEPLPVDGAFLLFALGIDPRPTSRDAAFALLDRVEKVDPARAGVAPIRLRLGLIARAARVNLERDVWPHLTGLSGVATSDTFGHPNGGSLRLHFDDEAAAIQVRTEVIPRLVLALGGIPLSIKDGDASVYGARQFLARVDREGSIVVIRIGPPNQAAPAINQDLRVEARRAMEANLGHGPSLTAFVLFWPGRLDVVGLPDAPPIVGRGSARGTTLHVTGLKPFVKSMMDRLPFDPPPDVSTPPPAARR